jgi:hypothetical protein
MSLGVYFHHVFTGHLLFLNFIRTAQPYKPSNFLMFVTAVFRNVEVSECLNSVIK